MGMDPETQTLHELTPEYLASLSPEKRKAVETTWAKFRAGDIVQVRPQAELGTPFRCSFRIAELGDNRMVLIPIGA